MPQRMLALICFLICIVVNSFSQSNHTNKQSVSPELDSMLCSERFFANVNKKVNKIDDDIHASASRFLIKIFRHEQKLRRKVAKKDSVLAQNIFSNDAGAQIQILQNKLMAESVYIENAKQYLPHIDTLKTSLKFLIAKKDFLPGNQKGIEQLSSALHNVSTLQSNLDKAIDIKKVLQERKKQLQEQLRGLGFAKELKKYNQQIYYYSEKMNEYKSVLEDPSKVEQKVISIIKELPAFQDFFRKHSQLSNLFNLQNEEVNIANLDGLQTRSNIQKLLLQRMASVGPNATAMLQQNVQAAQEQLSKLKDKVNELGGSGESEIPDFKPNAQKTKSFLQRLEYGTNLQSQRSNNWFPTTTDIGLSVGYKLTDKSIIGIGASYKVGWGQDIQHISITHQGVGIRSFADVKMKGSFYASGGFEYNYQQPFQSFTDLNGFDKWQKSGLVGLTKIVSLKNKMFKKTRLQMYWDFLSYQQVPRSQPLKFRVGYNF